MAVRVKWVTTFSVQKNKNRLFFFAMIIHIMSSTMSHEYTNIHRRLHFICTPKQKTRWICAKIVLITFKPYCCRFFFIFFFLVLLFHLLDFFSIWFSSDCHFMDVKLCMLRDKQNMMSAMKKQKNALKEVSDFSSIKSNRSSWIKGKKKKFYHALNTGTLNMSMCGNNLL